jgi:macrolide transport system ATP-binding/permease protein
VTRFRIALARLTAMFRRRTLEGELENEIRSHIEMEAEDRIRAGIAPDEARRLARKKFGGVDQVKERYRDLRGVPFVENLIRDFHYGFRALSQAPTFTMTAVVSIALAIGANTAIFSFADALLLRPLPVPDGSGVVTLCSVAQIVTRLAPGAGRMSYADYRDYRDKLNSFEGLLLYDDIGGVISRDADDEPYVSGGYLVTGNFFDVLGIHMLLGRTFRPEEDQVPGRDAVMVLAHDLWKSYFAADPSVIGRKVRLNGLEFTIIGVAPESFTGINLFLKPNFFIPVMMGPSVGAAAGQSSTHTLLTRRDGRWFDVRGRLKPGISIRAASREAAALAASLEQSYPETNRGVRAAVQTEARTRMDTFPGLGAVVTAMFALITVILLIACANVANLLLTRSRDREREIAVRLAIGVGRLRLMRLLLVESLWIAGAGGVLAWFLAGGVLRILSTMEPQPGSDLPPYYLGIQMNERILFFTVAVSLASALIVGFVPALQSARTDLLSALKGGDVDYKRRGLFGKHALVVAQIAGAMLLLGSATQFRRAFDDALAANPGFRRDHRLTMRFEPGLAGYTDAQSDRFFEELIRRTLELPGVKSAALTSLLPMTYMNLGGHLLIPEDFHFPSGVEGIPLLSYVVDHRYFDTMGVPIIAGRGFGTEDRAGSPRVAVVNEAFATEYLGNNPVGKRVRLDDTAGPFLEIVGVTSTGKVVSVIEPPIPVIYLPLGQNPGGPLTLVAETYGDPAALAAPIRGMVRATDPKVPIYWVRTMDEVFESSLVGALRVVETVFNWASVMGLVLALVGLYAVVSYQVAQKTREVGIRIALGAERSAIMKLFLNRAMVTGIAGVGIGIVLNLAANREARFNFGAPTVNQPLLVLTAASMLAVTALAAAVPARRASRVDPQQALRHE